MPDRTPAEKLRMKNGMSAALLHIPAGMVAVLGIPADVIAVDDPAGADFVLDFAATQAEAEDRLAMLKPVVDAATLAWIAYPKGSKAAGYDLNRDTVAASARAAGMVVVANVAIDETWSALRVRPFGP